MPVYTPSKIGVGPESTGFGVPADNIYATKFGISQDVDVNPALTVSKLGLSASLSPNRVRYFEDFLLKNGATIPLPLAVTEASPAGTPVNGFVTSSLNGEYSMKHDATSEAQNMRLDFADTLPLDPTKNIIFEARLKINFAGAAFSADQRFVCGLASAANATLDSVASNVWFRIEGANLNILCEADDGTTDTDDQDTGYDIVDNTYVTLRIDMSSLSDIKFYVDGKLQTGAKVSASALTAANKLQPFIAIQKDAGTEQEEVIVDYIYIEQDRT